MAVFTDILFRNGCPNKGFVLVASYIMAVQLDGSTALND